MSSAPRVELATSIAGVRFPNPVFTASGCAAAGRELAPYSPPDALGAVVTKSIMLAPRSGRATPRMAETPSGMLNGIGLQGPGIEEFLARDLPWLTEHGGRAIVSIAGTSVAEYASLAGRLRGRPGVVALEVNISCPNVADRGEVFACDPTAAASVISAVRRSCAFPVIAKLSPDVTDIVEIARAVVAAGAHAVTLVNTLLGLVIDTTTMRPALSEATGGLSGPAIRPVALRCVWQVHAALPEVPIIGAGGVRTGLDALAFLLAGASAVQVGTTIFSDPGAPVRILAELTDALAERGFAHLAEAVGYAHRPPPAPPASPGEVAEDGAPMGVSVQGDAPAGHTVTSGAPPAGHAAASGAAGARRGRSEADLAGGPQ